MTRNQDNDFTATRPEPQSLWRRGFADFSLLFIIISNLIIIYLAERQGWLVGEVLIIFWAQSVIIGVANFIRILGLKEFSTKGLEINDQPVAETQESKVQIAIFFLIHYNIFHLAYLTFIIAEHSKDFTDMFTVLWIAAIIFLMALSHFYSLYHHWNKDYKDKKPNLGHIMFYPYIRIIPMHLCIVFAPQDMLLYFMILKTVADAGMHMAEHSIFRR